MNFSFQTHGLHEGCRFDPDILHLGIPATNELIILLLNLIKSKTNK